LKKVPVFNQNTRTLRMYRRTERQPDRRTDGVDVRADGSKQ